MGTCIPFKKEVFLGLFEKGYKMIVFRFLPSGEVYVGISNYTLDITGTFIHIKGTSFQSGVFENGASFGAFTSHFFIIWIINYFSCFNVRCFFFIFFCLPTIFHIIVQFRPRFLFICYNLSFSPIPPFISF